jgi:type I restriction enzyme, R subunit
MRNDTNIPTTLEKQFVEAPFLQQLESMAPIKWKVLRLDRWGQTEAETGRTSWIQPVMMKDLEDSIIRLNPWLEQNQVHDAVHDITTFQSDNLITSNKNILNLLFEGTSADDKITGERGKIVRYIDFNNPDKNSFIAVSEMRFRILGSDKSFFPDIILFVNGLPLIIVECKSPRENDAIGTAIDQLMRYSEQRGYNKEGNKDLFFYNQFLVATCRDTAKFGTITTHLEKHFYKWSDPYPFELNEIPHGETSPNDQQRLVQGMLYPENLLSIIQSFTVFSEDDDGHIIKVVGRYQQFRAVKKTIKKLLQGKNKRERGGIIWHTQGSGKSLTMVFLIREMYNYAKLQSWKVVLLTDRKQLDSQLKETARNVGYSINDPSNAAELKAELRTSNAEIVSAMIHKFQERELNEIFPELNIDEKILILTDEAHRSQYSLLGSNLDKAVPNATRIAFTGTPIEPTKDTFGGYIDKYTMRQSVEDGVTLKIIYEGRVHDSTVKDQKGLDALFDDVFSECSLDERLQVIGYGTRQSYMEAWSTIRAKAADMLCHYLKQIFPNSFKAQIVTCSKEAAHRYNVSIKEELKSIVDHFNQTPDIPYISKYLEEHIANLQLPSNLKETTIDEKSIRFSQINMKNLIELESAVILSAGHNDPPYIQEYSVNATHEKQILSFKTPFGKEKDGTKGNIGILIVVEMLLTGFDAPIEQVMYLDRMVVAHNLLQAIARVNRTGGENKDHGFIVDYVGVGSHLREALNIYFKEEEANEAYSLIDETEIIKSLDLSHKALWEVLNNSGINDFNDLDAFYDIFYDEETRFRYIEAYRRFMKAMNDVFPRKEALEYVKDMLRFTEINVQAGRHLHDSRMSMKGVPDKLRMIADKHLESLGIEEKVKPISILDESFFENVNKRTRIKTKAAEIEHAIREHITLHIEEDPELYASFSEALMEILRSFRDNWNEIYIKLEELRRKIKTYQNENTYGLNRKTQMPFYRIFKKEIFGERELSENEISTIVGLTKEMFEEVKREISLTGFWQRQAMQNNLKSKLQKILIGQEFGTLPDIFSKYNQIITRVMEVAKKNNDTIIYTE